MSEEEFEKIYREYRRKIYNYVYGRLLHREAADDVTTDVFVSVWEHFERRKHGNFSAWIFTIAKNFTTNYKKQARLRYEILTDKIPETLVYPSHFENDTNTLKDPDNERARNILSKLSDRERDFLELRYGL